MIALTSCYWLRGWLLWIVIDALQDKPGVFPRERFSMDVLRWVFGIVQSRALSFKDEDKEVTALVPLFANAASDVMVHDTIQTHANAVFHSPLSASEMVFFLYN